MASVMVVFKLQTAGRARRCRRKTQPIVETTHDVAMRSSRGNGGNLDAFRDELAISRADSRTCKRARIFKRLRTSIRASAVFVARAHHDAGRRFTRRATPRSPPAAMSIDHRRRPTAPCEGCTAGRRRRDAAGGPSANRRSTGQNREKQRRGAADGEESCDSQRWTRSADWGRGRPRINTCSASSATERVCDHGRELRDASRETSTSPQGGGRAAGLRVTPRLQPQQRPAKVSTSTASSQLGKMLRAFGEDVDS